jgi:hypothetical protein
MDEHLSVLLIVGTLALIYVMSGSPCFSGEKSHSNTSACDHHPSSTDVLNDGMKGVRNDGMKGVRNDGMKGVRNDGMKGVRNDGMKGVDNFRGGSSKYCPYVDDGDIPVEYASMNYQQAIQSMSLEEDIQNSHSKWIGAIEHRTTSASKESVRDDPNDINPWVGLRRPNYKTKAQPLAEARTIASDIPCEMLDNSGSYTIN